LAQRGLNFVRRAIRSSKYDIIILDEANVAVDYGLINPAELLEIARNKPDSLELVFTGRGAPRELINIADTVSEVKEIKHHYRKGIPARAGIEY
jgi:cob(I)alamin adenosyltransferase